MDLNIMATAQAGIPEALRRLDILVRASRFIPGGMKKAPEEYWEQFRQGTPYEDGERFLVWNLGRILLADPETRAASARSASRSLIETRCAA